jgi:hypothetical protein
VRRNRTRGFRCSRLECTLSVDGVFIDRSRSMIHVAVDGDGQIAGFFKERSDGVPPSWAA